MINKLFHLLCDEHTAGGSGGDRATCDLISWYHGVVTDNMICGACAAEQPIPVR